MYLVAIIDWYSRYVEEALELGQPEIFNSDQGVQFTSKAFTGWLEEAQIAISMDGRGRVLDNIFVERLWRSVKYEDIYLKEYRTVPELEVGLEDYFCFYNHERPHQALGYRTPAQVHFGELEAQSLLEGGERVPQATLF